MNETIHIYIDSLTETDTHAISTSKTRLWPSILISLRWLFSHTTSQSTFIQNGLGLMAINNLAIAVEGFLIDILAENISENYKKKVTQIEKIENSNWNSKVKIYNATFPQKLNNCKGYKTIEILLLIRNNIAHGRTHRQTNKIDLKTNQQSKVESTHYNYQRARILYRY